MFRLFPTCSLNVAIHLLPSPLFLLLEAGLTSHWGGITSWTSLSNLVEVALGPISLSLLWLQPFTKSRRLGTPLFTIRLRGLWVYWLGRFWTSSNPGCLLLPNSFWLLSIALVSVCSCRAAAAACSASIIARGGFGYVCFMFASWLDSCFEL